MPSSGLHAMTLLTSCLMPSSQSSTLPPLMPSSSLSSHPSLMPSLLLSLLLPSEASPMPSS
eukprot:11299671-Ditylum_brightwellii.AAC.1